MKKYFIFIILALLFFFQIWRFGSNPPALYWDELAIGVDAYSVAQTGRDIHRNSWFQAIYPSYGDYKAPVPIWLTAIFVKIFGLHEWVLRLPFLLMSLWGLVGFFLLFRLILGNLGFKKKSFEISLLATGILLITPWHYHFARIGFESGMSLAILIWTMLYLIWGLKKQGWLIVLAGFLAVMGIYTYFSMRIIIPLFALSAFLIYWQKIWSKKWSLIVTLSIFIMGIKLLSNSPFYQQSEQLRWSAANIISDGKAVNQSAQLILANNNTFYSRIIYHRYWFLAKDFLQNYLTHFSSQFLFINGDINLRHHSGWGGELLLASLPILLAGLYWIFANWSKKWAKISLLWLLIAPITASIPYENPHASRAIYMLLPLGLILGFGVLQIKKSLNTQSGQVEKIVWGILLGSLILNFSLYLEDYFDHYSFRSEKAWQVNNKLRAQTVLANQDESKNYFISDADRLPALSILFYQPKLISLIQPKTKNIANQNYQWLSGFGNYHFGNVEKLINSNQNVIIK